METFEITEMELNQIEYNDNAIKNLKTPKQKLAIELSERDEILNLRKRRELESLERIKNDSKYVYINTRPGKFQDKFVLEHEITTKDIEAEIEFWFNY